MSADSNFSFTHTRSQDHNLGSFVEGTIEKVDKLAAYVGRAGGLSLSPVDRAYDRVNIILHYKLHCSQI